MHEGTQPGPDTMGTLGKLGPPADKHWVEKWRRERKIASVSDRARALFISYT